MSHFVPSSLPPEGLGALLLLKLVERYTPDFFAADRPIQVCRAPGRLDVLSGFGGERALALHLPTAEAACVAVQRRDDELVRLWSLGNEEGRTQRLSVRLPDLGVPGAPIPYDEARAFLGADPRDAWCAHLLGGVLVLARERGFRPANGFDLLLHSDVPEGVGAGSSAAVEVATMQAVAAAYGLPLSGREVAALCRVVEREVVGRDRGAAAQMTAACCEGGRLLALRGDDAAIEDDVAVPEELEFVGIDSGIGPDVACSTDPALGREESGRAERFLELLRGPPTAAVRRELGELMFASQQARAAGGQRHDAVELLIAKARERIADGAALVGASAVGRGVVVLLGERTAAWHEALRLKKALRDATGRSAHIFRYSSPGAEAFGAVELRPFGG